MRAGRWLPTGRPRPRAGTARQLVTTGTTRRNPAPSASGDGLHADSCTLADVLDSRLRRAEGGARDGLVRVPRTCTRAGRGLPAAVRAARARVAVGDLTAAGVQSAGELSRLTGAEHVRSQRPDAGARQATAAAGSWIRRVTCGSVCTVRGWPASVCGRLPAPSVCTSRRPGQPAGRRGPGPGRREVTELASAKTCVIGRFR